MPTGFVRRWERRRSLSTSSYPSPSEHTPCCTTRSPTLTPYLACSARNTLLANLAYPPRSPGSLGRRRGRRKALEMVPVPRGAVLIKIRDVVGQGRELLESRILLSVAPFLYQQLLFSIVHAMTMPWAATTGVETCTAQAGRAHSSSLSVALQATARLCAYTREREDVSLLSELRGLQGKRTHATPVTQPSRGPSQHPEESRLPIRNQTAQRLVDNSVLEKTEEVIIMEKE